MLRFAPLDGGAAALAAAGGPEKFLRSIGGDELNVAVASVQIGVPARWVSVLPEGPLGDVVAAACSEHGVEFRGLRIEGDLGIFTVLPQQQTVHYQRRHSAFALHEPRDLAPVLKEALRGGSARPWLHVTGITPLVSKAGRESWHDALEQARCEGIPVSLDLNHRKQLGTLDELWACVAPHAPRLEVLVLSEVQLAELAALHDVPRDDLSATESTDRARFEVMGLLQRKLGCRRIALCRKARDAAGRQRRWSLLTELRQDGEVVAYSTYATPVWHRPKDELGGGSAWLAGLLNGLFFEPAAGGTVSALRRADLLAALCQESEGDFSRVSGAELRAAEVRFQGVEAWLPGTAPDGLPPTMEALSAEEAARRVERTLASLGCAGVVAILRAKGSPAIAVQRAVELAELGCRAIEVTMDSSDWSAVLQQMRQRLPPTVSVGIGTVMDETVCDIGGAASLGATFALSPIDPIGFVEECHRRGVLAIPSALTSNECWQLHRRGVRLIKLFHAGMVGPAVLKSMLDVSPLKAMNIFPSGGVSPGNAEAWWDAGAFVIGMGSNLVGKDVGLPPGTPEFDAAVATWEAKERGEAASLFAKVAARFGPPSS